MKFLSFNYEGLELYGVKVKKEEKAWNLIKIFKEFDNEEVIPATLREAIEIYGVDFIEKVRKVLNEVDKLPNKEQYKISLNAIVWRAPITRTPKNIFCVGHNYPALIEEIDKDSVKTPEDVVIFTKVATSIAANNEVVPSHKEVTSQLDYEGELAVVIAKSGKNIIKPLALDYVFGYTIMNDITANDIQYNRGQFFLGKSLEKSAVIGPYLVTKDEFYSPESMNIVTKVNGEIRQNSMTSEMLFRIDDLLVEISKFIPFEPADIISTGTPAGIGSAMKPPQYLKEGDEIKITIEGIGTLTTIIGE
ncbi:fumarylacetoacetate hydrolase family protein [Gemella sp. GH3]|uniref:fumarylacetoacetate hydrolase family protein n=1 Tax=unclassified Gemella TaxID=2624949 RepID=UPI0015CF99C7|nr:MULTISPECIES: fumarylacetoacetate hydrolase family protein [unclassified Gemella]MBF0713296.1 fumarylacetoacetate hydrolase family protein [Gemella sp. GH3.1]NYS50248.1 fumarylacetoacetate hydrolase family protein [Gemella sp. GH3]